LFDFKLGTLHPLKDGDHVLFQYEDRALVRREGAWLLWRVGSGYLQLPIEPLELRPTLRTTPVVYAPPLVIDLALGEVLGSDPGRPLALSTRGWLLVPEHYEDGQMPIAYGPLRWRAPTPLTESRSAP
jgi:hypothetical protein